MADQIPSLQDLAKTISSDIIGKLKLPSGDAITKSLLKELQNLSASNKLLGKIVETADKKETSTKKEASPLSSPDKAASYKLPDVLSSSIKSLFDKFTGPLPSQDKEKVVPLTPKENKLPDIVGSLKSVFSDFSKKLESNKQTPEPTVVSKPIEENKLPDIIGSLKSVLSDFSKKIESNKQTPAAQPANEPKSQLEQIEKPKDVRIIEFGQEAVKKLGLAEILGAPLEKLNKTFSVIKGSFEGIAKGFKDGEKGEGLLGGLLPKGALAVMGGATLILGGLAAITAAFNTNTGEKGALEAVGKGGIKGGLAAVAKGFFKGGALKTILKRIPILGSIMSYGFALQRFSNGDVFGGVTDLVSGTVGLLDLVAPGIGTVLSTGVDVFQAVMDAKGGGSSKEASSKKTDILTGWVKELSKKLEGKIEGVPILGSLFLAGKAFASGDVMEGLHYFTKMFPVMGWVGKLLDSRAAAITAEAAAETTEDILTPLGKKVLDKIKKVITPITNIFESVSSSIINGAKKILSPLVNLSKDLAQFLVARAKDLVSPITNLAEKLGERILGISSSIINTFKSFIGGSWTALKDIAKEAGEKLLAKGKDLAAPVTKIAAEIIEKLLSVPKNIISFFSKSFRGLLPVADIAREAGEMLLSKGKAFLSPLTNIAKSIGDRVFSIPGKIIDMFKGSIGSMFGSTATSAVTNIAGEGVERAAGLVPKLLKGASKLLSKLPLIGSLISIGAAAKRFFKEGDSVGAGIELLSGLVNFFLPGPLGLPITLALDSLNAVLDSKTEGMTGAQKTEAKTGLIGNWISSIGKYLKEKIMKLPFIGPMITGFEALNTDPIGVLRAFQSAHPICGMIADFFEEDLPKTDTPRTMGNIVGTYMNKMGDWLKEKIMKIPYVGPLIESFQAIYNNPIDFLKGIGTFVPFIGSVADFFESNLKDPEKSSVVDITADWLGTMKDWLKEKLMNLPYIGKLIEGFQMMSKDPMKGLELLSSINSMFGSIAKFFATPTTDMEEKSSFEFKDPFKAMNEMILSKAKEWWKNTNKWMRAIAQEILPDSVVASLNEGIKAETQDLKAASTTAASASIPAVAPQPTKGRGGAIKPMKDGMLDPEGGLLISSPKIGGLWQLDKKDGVIAAPMADNKLPATSSNSFGKAELILERIAGNTASSNQNISNLINGFNNLAKALERTLGESAKIPVVVNTTNNQQSPIRPSSSQLANAGNSSISDFRSATIEGSRFRPA